MSNRIIEVIKRGAAGTDGAFGLTTVAAKPSGFTATLAERAYAYRCTATLTMALQAASALGNGWHCLIDADGGDVTVDPDGAELVNGAATATVSDGNMAWLYCDGSAFYLRFLVANEVADLLGATTAGGIRDVLELDNEAGAALTAGAADAYTLTPSNTITAYSADRGFWVRWHATNTGASTINIDGLGAKNIKIYDETNALADPAAGDLYIGNTDYLYYDGTQFIRVAPYLASDARPGLVEAATTAEMTAGTAGKYPDASVVKGFTAVALLDRQTAAVSTELDFVLQNSDYENYKFVFENIVATTDGTTFEMETSTDGGSTFDTGASDYKWRHYGGSAASSTGDTSIQLVPAFGNDTGENVSGEITLTVPATIGRTNIHGQMTYSTTAGVLGGVQVHGKRDSAFDVDAVRFKMATGAITSGSIAMYGIK